MNTENHPPQPTSSTVTTPRAAGRIDRLKELQKLPAIILQPETKNWTLVPTAFPDFNNFYRL